MKGTVQKKTIGLVPFGAVSKDFLEEIGTELKKCVPIEYVILPSIPVPQLAYDSKRRQYNSRIFLDQLKRREAPIQHIIGVTDCDLFTPKWSFVFHESDIVLGIGVFSMKRLPSEYYGKIPDAKIFSSRVLTEMIHVLGHIHGLHHCKNPYCVMYFSTAIDDTDRKGHQFCQDCQKKMGA